MSYDIKNQWELKQLMELYPEAFLSLSKPAVKTKHHDRGGIKTKDFLLEGKYQLIRPGSFAPHDDPSAYFCRSVNPEAVSQLEDQGVFERIAERRWRLKKA